MTYTRTILVVLLVCLFAGLSSAQKKSKIEGVWELVSAKQTVGDSTIYVFSPKDSRMIKIITKTHFAFLSQAFNRPKFKQMGNDEEMLLAARTFGAGGGTYTFDGNTYTEHIQFFLQPNSIGMSIPFKVKIENDQLIQSGTMPRKAAGFGNQDSELYEVYKRIE